MKLDKKWEARMRNLLKCARKVELADLRYVLQRVADERGKSSGLVQ